jgi:hypothetical protein
MISKTLVRFVVFSDKFGFLSEHGVRILTRSLTKPKTPAQEHYAQNIEDAAFFDDVEATVYFRNWGTPRPITITFKF